MRRVKPFLVSFFVSVVATLILAVATILIMMFSVHTDSAYVTGLFGSVYFEAKPTGGNVTGTMGVSSVPRLLAVAGVIFIVSLISIYIYRALKVYRSTLLEKGM